MNYFIAARIAAVAPGEGNAIRIQQIRKGLDRELAACISGVDEHGKQCDIVYRLHAETSQEKAAARVVARLSERGRDTTFDVLRAWPLNLGQLAKVIYDTERVGWIKVYMFSDGAL